MKPGLVAISVDTATDRVLVVFLGAGILLLAMVLGWRLFPPAFFHGFLVATGIFLSFDIVVFHWVFRLHWITEGPEADVIEPVLVALGIVFVAFGLTRERRERRSDLGANEPP